MAAAKIPANNSCDWHKMRAGNLAVLARPKLSPRGVKNGERTWIDKAAPTAGRKAPFLDWLFGKQVEWRGYGCVECVARQAGHLESAS